MKFSAIGALVGVAFAGAASIGGQTPKLPAINKMPPAVPYHWRNAVIVAGGFVTGIEFSPALAGLVYARTDVGGAYRSDDSGGHWTALTDRFNQEDSSYLGIESIGVDPQDANKVYLAEGMYSAEWGGPSAIFRSSDKGRTFEKTAMSFKMGGNDDGRGVGERLAVDPSLGSILYFGSRKAGLWRSTDSAKTWKHVDSFPVADIVPGPETKTGITFVAFDKSDGAKGSATRTIYVGVAQAGAGLYRSQDAGSTWEQVPGAPKGLFPTHAAVDPGEHLYFTYVNASGPNGITDGAIWSFSPKDNKWKDISPVHPGVGDNRKFGFGGIAMDAEHPGTLMVTTLDKWSPQDQIFRSTNGGKSWKEIGPDAACYAPNAPWVYWHRGNCTGTGWMNDIAIDPFHSEEVLYTTGEGIFGTRDVTNADVGKATHWGFPDEGVEELVATAVVSPASGAPLLSLVGDLSGYRHESLEKSPSGGFFDNPRFSTGSGLDFAASNPMIVARVGYGDKKIPRGAYSTDNGVSWKAFDSEPGSSVEGGGKVAVSADGKTVIWSPAKGVPYLTHDWGKNWVVCAGLAANERVVADRVNALKFFSFNEETGQLMMSVDGGQNFVARAEPLAAKANHVVIAPVPGVEGELWVSVGDKVLHSTDSGATFAELKGVHRVNNIGFGKAAPGQTAPAIYLTGKVGDRDAMLRSDDGARSWVRMDDPEHQFGYKNAVTGDGQVYGRVYLATGGRGIVYGEPAGGGQ